MMYFNPRSPRGERQDSTVLCWLALQISIHALREESDGIKLSYLAQSMDFNPRSPRGERLLMSALETSIYGSFQSTLSARRATIYQKRDYRLHMISIHALREESDIDSRGIINELFYFNPRSPRGERPLIEQDKTA